jgi:FtsH-binding integral membrane protein
MKIKEVLVFVLLASSIVAAFGGFALVSRGVPMGWVGVAVALPMLFVVQRAMRVVSSPTEAFEVAATAEPPETPAER